MADDPPPRDPAPREGDSRTPLPRGIVPVLQTPFDGAGRLVEADLLRLIDDAIDAGAQGFLAPAAASEVAHLHDDERERIIRICAERCVGRVPFIVGASNDDPRSCRRWGQLAANVGAAAWLVAVPPALYDQPLLIPPFFQRAVEGVDLPLVIQDLQFNGPGMTVERIESLRQALPTLTGLKIETAPAGPKYSVVRQRFGCDFWIAGGWAVPQMIEALDRGVDAMIPEASMVRVYAQIDALYRSGSRDRAVELFRRLLPILAFTNQDLLTSIAFFKRLLVRRGVFSTETMRTPGITWDVYNRCIADELIELYLRLHCEAQIIDRRVWLGVSGSKCVC